MSVKLGNTNIAGTQVLYSTTGNNTDGAMTQAATTTELNLKANDSDVVHKTGNETITGVKSYSAMPILIFPNETRGIAPSSDRYGGIVFLDKNGERLVIIEKDHLKDGTISCNLRASNPTTTGTANQATLGVKYPMSGNPYATAPASDINGSIVTTVNKSKAANGYFKLGNGLIIQWGWHSGSGSALTFPTPFTSTNYSVTANYRKKSSSGSGTGHVNFYPTSTTNCYFNSQGGDFQWIAIGY